MINSTQRCALAGGLSLLIIMKRTPSAHVSPRSDMHRRGVRGVRGGDGAGVLGLEGSPTARGHARTEMIKVAATTQPAT